MKTGEKVFILGVLFGLAVTVLPSVRADHSGGGVILDPALPMNLDGAIQGMQQVNQLVEQGQALEALGLVAQIRNILSQYPLEQALEAAIQTVDSISEKLLDPSLSQGERVQRVHDSIPLFYDEVLGSDAYAREHGLENPPPLEREVSLVCQSIEFQPAQCSAGLDITRASLQARYSKKKCIEGVTWGVTADRRAIWVTRGCRGSFLVAGF